MTRLEWILDRWCWLAATRGYTEAEIVAALEAMHRESETLAQFLVLVAAGLEDLRKKTRIRANWEEEVFG